MTSKKENKKDAFSVVMITQIIVCAALLAFLFIFCRTDSGIGSQIRKEYERVMKRDFSSEDYKEAYSAASSFIKGEKFTKDNGSALSQSTEESSSAPMGGDDIHSDNLSILEGVSFEKYSLSNEYIKPLDEYYISSPFGYREDPISGGSGVHTGIDLAADEGTRIKAARAGKVVKAEYSDGYGYYVLIAHENSVNTLYAHCSILKCNAGDRVEQGETVALVGSTGNSTGSHLHFEVRKNGVKLDPTYAVKL